MPIISETPVTVKMDSNNQPVVKDGLAVLVFPAIYSQEEITYGGKKWTYDQCKKRHAYFIYDSKHYKSQYLTAVYKSEDGKYAVLLPCNQPEYKRYLAGDIFPALDHVIDAIEDSSVNSMDDMVKALSSLEKKEALPTADEDNRLHPSPETHKLWILWFLANLVVAAKILLGNQYEARSKACTSDFDFIRMVIDELRKERDKLKDGDNDKGKKEGNDLLSILLQQCTPELRFTPVREIRSYRKAFEQAKQRPAA